MRGSASCPRPGRCPRTSLMTTMRSQLEKSTCVTMIHSDEKSSIVSIFNSPSDEKEESLEDVFQTIMPTSPTQTQPISLSLSIQSIQCNPIPLPSSMLQSAVPLSRVAPLHTQSIDANIRNQIDCTRGWPHQDALHLLHGH